MLRFNKSKKVFKVLFSSTLLLSQYVQSVAAEEINEDDLIVNQSNRSETTSSILEREGNIENSNVNTTFEIDESNNKISGVTYPEVSLVIIFNDDTNEVIQSDTKGLYSYKLSHVNNIVGLKVIDTNGEVIEEIDLLEENKKTEKLDISELDEDLELDENNQDETEMPAETNQSVTDEQFNSEGEEVVSDFSSDTGTTLKSTFSLEREATVYYYVKESDTFEKIVDKYSSKGVTSEKLLKWNNLTSQREFKPHTVISLNGMNYYNELNGENIQFGSRQEFINYISPKAEKIARENGLYASIMIAQAALETGFGTSDKADIANNFFGIKADSSYQGYSIIMPTWEIINNKRVEVDAKFRLYPTFDYSLLDNMDKLKNGLPRNSAFYNGIWVENTNSYKDATLFLTGKYATDPSYYLKLNNLIEMYNLTKYDYKSSNTTPRNMYISKSGYQFSNLPSNHHSNNIKTLNKTDNYINESVKVMQTTLDGKFSHVYMGENELGWVDSFALSSSKLVDSSVLNYVHDDAIYTAYIGDGNYSIDTLPWGTNGFRTIGNTSDLTGTKVSVLNENSSGHYALIINSNGESGWVDKRAFGLSQGHNSAMVTNGQFNIDTLPWGVKGYQTLGYTSDYLNTLVELGGSVKNGSYHLIRLRGQDIGWVDHRALGFVNTISKNYTEYIGERSYNIDSLPWGTEGHERLGSTTNLLGAKVNIIAENTSGTYALITQGDKQHGWVDKRALGLKQGHNSAMVIDGKYNIDSLPWGTPGYETLSYTSEYLNSLVEIAGSINDDSYYLIRHNGADIGWVDYRSLGLVNALDKNYKTFITNGNYNIDSLPWGTAGFEKIDSSSEYLNVHVNVIASNLNGNYVLISDNNTNIGWIDTRALAYVEENMIETRDVIIQKGGYAVTSLPMDNSTSLVLGDSINYLGKHVKLVALSEDGKSAFAVNSKNEMIGWIDNNAFSYNNIKLKNYIIYPDFNIDSRPWGEKGNKSMGIGTTSDYLNEKVYIIETSSSGVYYLINNSKGETLGWVDYRAFGNMDGSKRTIKKSGYSFDTLPWGTYGYETLGWSNDYIDKEVTVLGESKNGYYSAVLLNGIFYGWIDNKAFSPIIYIDPGHGGSESGAVTAGVYEKDLNLKVSNKVRDLLENKGYTVVMARENDTYLSLSHRAQEANRLGADLFVSIHHNAFNGSAHGIETFYYNENGNTNNPKANDKGRIQDSKKLAEEIQKELIAETGAFDRGVKKANFHVIRETTMPAVLVEGGFIDNTVERAKLVLDSYQQKIANAIFKGINSFLNLWK